MGLLGYGYNLVRPTGVRDFGLLEAWLLVNLVASTPWLGPELPGARAASFGRRCSS